MSPREEEVFRFLGAGLMNKQIAYELGIGEATVKALVSTVLRKTGTCTRSQLALVCHGISLAEELTKARAAMIDRNPPPLCLPAQVVESDAPGLLAAGVAQIEAAAG
ncbi:helix-turn-helix transcriptional regulator [uncultured Rhodoblastus sp.]|uniref:helix-turn-helix domain-containing protein n=1 Tax=uncultured Rhodoblastus sp. TaxID=543037 RepID=UPI0025D9173A|nr:helix-turn-helix transcriptional regulator [uncultured Rhodoblastus sp.]